MLMTTITLRKTAINAVELFSRMAKHGRATQNIPISQLLSGMYAVMVMLLLMCLSRRNRQSKEGVLSYILGQGALMFTGPEP